MAGAPFGETVPTDLRSHNESRPSALGGQPKGAVPKAEKSDARATRWATRMTRENVHRVVPSDYVSHGISSGGREHNRFQ